MTDFSMIYDSYVHYLYKADLSDYEHNSAFDYDM